MSTKICLVITCDRCWAQVHGTEPEGWITKDDDDYCDNCAEYVQK